MALLALASAGLTVACLPETSTCDGRPATVVGTAGDDTLTGTAGADVIAGLGGNDTIRGLGGDDWLCGDAGEDTIEGDGTTPGNDVILGGPGVDWVTFEHSTTGADLDLAAGTSRIQGDDELSEIENVRGGQAADLIRGDAAANAFILGYGDLAEGRGGNDFFDATCQNCGITLSYESATGPVNVDADGGVATGAAGTDLFRLTPTRLDGGPAGDRLTCSRTTPTCYVRGGSGADIITGTPGDDWLTGDLGNDTLSGNGGTDVAAYQRDEPVTVNLGTGTATGQGTDTLVGMRRVVGSSGNDILVGGSLSGCQLEGTGGNDRLTAGSAGCTLLGGPGNDILTGGAARDDIFPDDDFGQTTGNDQADGRGGDDVIHGDGGNDNLLGGPGTDSADYGRSTTGLVADMATGEVTGNGVDTAVGFENFLGGSRADTIRGNDGPNVIDGFAGDDTLFGNGGADALRAQNGKDWMHGGTGNDVMDGGEGDDTLYGGPDIDRAVYTDSPPGVTVDLTTRQAITTSGFDQVNEFENLLGSLGADDLRGDPGPNDIDGSTGADACTGGGGVDVFHSCP